MCRKLIGLVCLATVLGALNTASAALIAYWPLNGDARDMAGNHHGRLVGGASFVRDTSRGIVLRVDGVDGHVVVPHENDMVFSSTDSYTIMAWAYLEALPGSWQTVMAKSRDQGTHYGIWVTDSGEWMGGGWENRGSRAATQVWVHVAYVQDGNAGTGVTYVDGAVDWRGGPRDGTGAGDFWIGGAGGVTEFLRGMIDEVRVYNHVLTEEEIQIVMLSGAEGYPFASGPSPKDGALHADTWVTLSWRPGDFAVSHDVYLGESFDDVNDATQASGAFRGNQVTTFYVAGFPGFAYPDGLVPGTTYYWRIDEVNSAEPNSPWKGPVWSFFIPPRKAYNPNPPDGAKFVAADVTLTWTAGLGTRLHTVYFGDNLDTVTNAAGGPPQAATQYKPAALALGKTYYWRVDEFDGSAAHKGDVWSFVTAKVGGGVKGQYFKGMDFNTLALTRVDPQINFNWGANAPDPVVGVDQFSVRWTGEVEAAFTETYTFYPRADDGVRLWIDGQPLVDAWIDQSATEYSGKVDLVAGNTYSLQMEMYENGGDAVAELRWSSSRTPKQLIPQAALSPPVKASGPKPGNGATGVSLTPVPTWNPGDFAASHEVYFGTVADAVRNATKASPEYKGSKALGAESYSPGKLAWFTTYYWRVDEVNNVNANSPWVGNVWSFTTGDFLLIDDFEGYNAGANQIWYSWHDGLGYGAPGAPPYFAGNGTGAAVGDENTASYTEETIVHSGRQSMPLNYDNNKQGFAKYSEAELTLTAPRDWTEEGVAELSLWVRGDAANVAEPLYVAVSSAAGQPAVVVHPDPKAAQITTWTEWVIPLQSFADKGINLKSLDWIALGLGTRGNMTTPGGSGKMYFDDIRLYRLRAAP